MSSFCVIVTNGVECLRRGDIDIYFPGSANEPDGGHTLVCTYHAEMLAEQMAEMGVQSNINTQRRRQVALHKTGDQRRYPKFVPPDNTEYDN